MDGCLCKIQVKFNHDGTAVLPQDNEIRIQPFAGETLEESIPITITDIRILPKESNSEESNPDPDRTDISDEDDSEEEVEVDSSDSDDEIDFIHN